MPIPESESDYWLSIEPGERAWRYMSFPAFTKLLRTEELFFRKVSEFSDPYEGSLPHSFPEIRHRDAEAYGIPPGRFSKVYSAINDHARQCSYANCWHLNDNESEAMWSKYGNKSVAIIADIDDIIPAFKSQDRDLFARPTRYFEYFKSHQDLSGDDRARLEGIAGEIYDQYAAVNFIKRDSFSYENEFRILYSDLTYFPAEEYTERDHNIVVDGEKEKYPAFTDQAEGPLCVDFTQTPDGEKRDIKANLGKLIDEIRVAPGAGDWFYKTVCDVVDKIAQPAISSDLVHRSVVDLHEPKQ